MDARSLGLLVVTPGTVVPAGPRASVAPALRAGAAPARVKDPVRRFVPAFPNRKNG